MDDIIQQIIDSELMAQRLIAEAEKEQQSHEEKITAEIEAYRESAYNDYKENITKQLDALKTESLKTVQQIENAAKKMITQLQQRSSSQKNDWTEYLFQKILDGDIG